jgi:LPS export ABC transporter permease LptG/LPS export ABC transporter permease LptF
MESDPSLLSPLPSSARLNKTVRILNRYILREVLTHAAIGGVVFTFVLFMRNVTQILELVVRSSAPIPSVAELIFLTIPSALTITIPMAALVGILIGLSRMAADSEVTAMRASGIGTGIFVRTIGWLAILTWILATINTVFIAPRSATALAGLQDQLKTSQASFEIQPRVFYEDLKNYILYVQDVVPQEGAAVWKKVFLADISNPTAPKITLAQEGVAVSDTPDSMRLHLVGAASHENVPKQPDQYTISTFQETDIPIPVTNLAEKKGSDEPALPQMSTKELLSQIAYLRQQPGWDQPNWSLVGIRRRWYLIEANRRFALPAACLVLALVGIPLGLSAKKGGKATGFVLTIALVFLYYVVSLAGLALARQGRVSPEIGVWLGNAVFLLAGVVLLWRVRKRPLEIGLRSLLFRLRKLRPRRLRARLRSEGMEAADQAPMRVGFPQILDDYILRDFLTYLGMVLATFSVLIFVFTFFELLGDIIRNRVPLVTVGEYLLHVIPSYIYVLTPLAVMIAVLVTFGLLEKANEVTAMKATGISVYRVVTPVLVISAVLAGGLFFANQFYLPSNSRQEEALRNQIKGKPAQTFFRPDRMWIFGKNNTIYYYELFDADRDTFGNISIFEFDPATFAVTKRIFAEHAHWDSELKRFVFSQGWSRSFNGSAIQEYRTFDVSTFSELTENPLYFKREVKQSSEMSYTELSQYIDDLQQSGFEVVRLKVQLYKKFAFPLITFVMSVLAVPFSLRAARRGALTGVALALGIGIVYFVVAGLFEAMGNISQLPPAMAAWSPDLVFALVGGYLILKVPT